MPQNHTLVFSYSKIASFLPSMPVGKLPKRMFNFISTSSVFIYCRYGSFCNAVLFVIFLEIQRGTRCYQMFLHTGPRTVILEILVYKANKFHKLAILAFHKQLIFKTWSRITVIQASPNIVCYRNKIGFTRNPVSQLYEGNPRYFTNLYLHF